MTSLPEMGGKHYSKKRFFQMLGYKPHAGQRAIHDSTAPRRVVSCGVRFGKSLAAAMEALSAAMEPRARSLGWVVAPTYDLADRVFSMIALIALEKLRHRVVSYNQHEMRLVLRNFGGGLSEIRGKSADNPNSLLGAGLDWLIIDEASRLKPAIWESYLSPRLLDRHGWALLISTPNGRNYFYDLWRRGQGKDPGFESWNLPSSANPLLDAGRIEEERGRLPARVFAQEYEAQFIEGSGAVFHNVRDLATGTWQEPVKGERYVAGLDLAKVEDFTVLVIMNRRYEVVFVDRFHRLDWNVQINRVGGHLQRYNRASVLCDTTGAGEPVYESMCRAGLNVEPYSFTAKSKAALIDSLSILCEQRKIVLPRAELWPDGIEELESYEFSVTDNGNTRTNAPSGMHDDIVISLALAAWQVRNAPGPPVFRTFDNWADLSRALR